MATVRQMNRAVPKMALSINTAESESPALSTATQDLAGSDNSCASPEAHSIESPLLESPSVATPLLVHPPTRAPGIRQADEAFDPAWTNGPLSSSTTHAHAFLHPPETSKTLVQENHSLLHLLDSKITWSDNSNSVAPHQGIEPEHCQTSTGSGGWFRNIGRWFGHSKQTADVIHEVKFELDDMPVDEFPIIPHTSGEYKPPWLSLVPLRPPGQSIVATLDFSAFDRIVDEPFAPTLSKGGEEGDPN